MNKIIDKLDDYRIYFKNRWSWIRCWFRHCFNKYKLQLVKEAIQGYPFDQCYFYEIQLRKLEEMKNYFEKSNILYPEYYIRILKYINLAIEMLHIVMDDHKGYYKNGLFKSVPAERTKDHPFNWDLVSNVKVNHRNAERFGAKKEWQDWDIYEYKAFYLYNKILMEKSQDWWD